MYKAYTERLFLKTPKPYIKPIYIYVYMYRYIYIYIDIQALVNEFRVGF